MKKFIALFILGSLSLHAETDYIHLDKTAVKNLQIKLVASEDTTFESTLFVIGHLTEVPSNHSVVSSRIPGRVVGLKVIAGDFVNKGDLVAKIESRQIGNPPPTINLYAPSTGIVADSHVRLGEPISPEKELLDILDLTQLWAVANIPQKEASKLKIGTKTRIRIPALENNLVEGELIRFGTTANASTGTLEAIFLIDNPENKLRPGMRAEYSIITATRKNVSVVPKEAVQGNLANRVVYIKDYDLPYSFIKAPVVTGEENDRFIEIKEGLFPGDEVVTQGAYLLGFSGEGNVSLKEALDAAHGHEHNEDGSEITPAQQAAKDAANNPNTTNGPKSSTLLFYQILCGLLVILIIISGIKNTRDHLTINRLKNS